MKRKPLIYASCATAKDPIHINVLHNDGEGTFNRYDLDPFKALTLAADLIQFSSVLSNNCRMMRKTF